MLKNIIFHMNSSLTKSNCTFGWLAISGWVAPSNAHRRQKCWLHGTCDPACTPAPAQDMSLCWSCTPFRYYYAMNAHSTHPQPFNRYRSRPVRLLCVNRNELHELIIIEHWVDAVRRMRRGIDPRGRYGPPTTTTTTDQQKTRTSYLVIS